MTTATPPERRSTHAMFDEAEASQHRSILEGLAAWDRAFGDMGRDSQITLRVILELIMRELEARSGK